LRYSSRSSNVIEGAHGFDSFPSPLLCFSHTLAATEVDKTAAASSDAAAATGDQTVDNNTGSDGGTDPPELADDEEEELRSSSDGSSDDSSNDDDENGSPNAVDDYDYGHTGADDDDDDEGNASTSSTEARVDQQEQQVAADQQEQQADEAQLSDEQQLEKLLDSMDSLDLKKIDPENVGRKSLWRALHGLGELWEQKPDRRPKQMQRQIFCKPGFTRKVIIEDADWKKALNTENVTNEKLQDFEEDLKKIGRTVGLASNLANVFAKTDKEDGPCDAEMMVIIEDFDDGSDRVKYYLGKIVLAKQFGKGLKDTEEKVRNTVQTAKLHDALRRKRKTVSKMKEAYWPALKRLVGDDRGTQEAKDTELRHEFWSHTVSFLEALMDVSFEDTDRRGDFVEKVQGLFEDDLFKDKWPEDKAEKLSEVLGGVLYNVYNCGASLPDPSSLP